jgi:hypothetical protein
VEIECTDKLIPSTTAIVPFRAETFSLRAYNRSENYSIIVENHKEWRSKAPNQPITNKSGHGLMDRIKNFKVLIGVTDKYTSIYGGKEPFF